MGFSVSREDIRRLEKAARDKDKKHLVEWSNAFELAISSELQREYDRCYKDQLANSLDLFVLTMVYSLAVDRNVTIKKNCAELYLDNFFKNFDKFRTGEFRPEDYLGRLKSIGINLIDYNYEHRTTPIIALVLSYDNINDLDRYIKYFEKQQSIILKLDDFQTDEKQIKKNISMINMCDRLYYIGESEIIDLYKQYAQQCRKPIIDGRFILEDNDLVDNIDE